MLNIVIIGASLAGGTTARALEKLLPSTHRIILIDVNDFAYFPPCGLRASVVPGWEERALAPLGHFFPQGSRHVVLPLTRVLSISPKEITISHPHPEHGIREIIEYHYAVVATGTTYAAPGRIVGPTRHEGISSLKILQSQIAKAHNILIVGGGAVGVEFLGEVLCFHTGKKVTLVSSASRLIPTWGQELHDVLYPQVLKLGADLIFNDRVILAQQQRTGVALGGKVFQTEKGRKVEADFVVVATGNKRNEHLVTAADNTAVDADGAIRTLKSEDGKGSTLQVDSTILTRVFAVGDCNDTLPTTAFGANMSAPIVAQNIVAHLTSSPLKFYTGPPMDVLSISLGSTGGAVAGLPLVGIRGKWVSAWMKGRDLMFGMSGFGKTFKWTREGQQTGN